VNDVIEWLAIRPEATDREGPGLRDAVASAIERELADRTPGADVLTDSERRRVILATTPHGGVALKRHRERSSARLRNSLRRPLLGSPARREWRALNSAWNTLQHAEGAPRMPRPIALLGAGGHEWMLTEFVPGTPLLDALRSTSLEERRGLLERIGASLHALALAGVSHGDLHAGNALVCNGELALLDWQQSRTKGPATRTARDLASLEFSLARGGRPRGDRLVLRRAALGDSTSRARLLQAGRRADDAAHDHYRGRTRRSLVVGRRFAAIEPSLGKGLRVASLCSEEIARALAAHDEALKSAATNVLKDDERARVTRVPLLSDSTAGAQPRSCIVKEVTKAGLARMLADPVRGTAAKRGWLGGHGLRARGIAATEPLAFIDLGGVQRRSVLLLEDTSSRPCLENSSHPSWDEVGEARLGDALLQLLLRLHRRGVDHGDLQASHLFGDIQGGAIREFVLIDLEGVRFERNLGDEARLRALAELNASLGDARLSSKTRHHIFDCYARALPFTMSREEALRSLVKRSLARRHRWTGADCATGSATSPR